MTARPKVKKIVSTVPIYAYFKPQGIPMTKLEVINLKVEEMEALKLKDMDNLDQKSAAQRMGISRSTFQRLLSSARKKMVSSIIEGKALRVEGGNYIPGEDVIETKCLKGRHHFYVKKGELDAEQEYKLSKVSCPDCGERLVNFDKK